MPFLIDRIAMPDGGDIKIEDVDVFGGKSGNRGRQEYRMFTRRDNNGEEVDCMVFDRKGHQIVGSSNSSDRRSFKKQY